MDGGREGVGGRDGWREGRREGGREGGWVGWMEGWMDVGREGGSQGGIKTEYCPKILRHRYVTSYGTSLIHFSPIHPGSPRVHEGWGWYTK